MTDHLMPVEIEEFVRDYRGCSDVRYLTTVFGRVMGKVGLKVDGERHGWHSIRRALATELLVRDVSLLNIVRFMRWSEACVQGQVGMVGIYARRNQSEVDRAIFKVHPFLGFWRE